MDSVEKAILVLADNELIDGKFCFELIPQSLQTCIDIESKTKSIIIKATIDKKYNGILDLRKKYVLVEIKDKNESS